MEEVYVKAYQYQIDEIEKKALKNTTNKTLIILEHVYVDAENHYLVSQHRYYTYAYYGGGGHSPYFIKGNKRYNICVDANTDEPHIIIVNVGRKRGDINLMDTA